MNNLFDTCAKIHTKHHNAQFFDCHHTNIFRTQVNNVIFDK